MPPGRELEALWLDKRPRRVSLCCRSSPSSSWQPPNALAVGHVPGTGAGGLGAAPPCSRSRAPHSLLLAQLVALRAHRAAALEIRDLQAPQPAATRAPPARWREAAVREAAARPRAAGGRPLAARASSAALRAAGIPPAVHAPLTGALPCAEATGSWPGCWPAWERPSRWRGRPRSTAGEAPALLHLPRARPPLPA